jgi:hypothetical protein
MTRSIKLGDTATDQFPVWHLTTVGTKVSGETAFTKRLWKDGVVDSETVTVAEIGSTGEYKVTFTPDDVGFWGLEIIPDYNSDSWYNEYEVVKPTLNIRASISGDDTTINVAIWFDQNGEPRTDLDGMAAEIIDQDGTQIVDMGSDAPNSEGISEFSAASGLLTADTPYLVKVTASKGSVTWTAMEGFTKWSAL